MVDVHKVLSNIEKFTNKIRSGESKGYTGKNLKNVISVGIGGSYLAVEMAYEALRYETKGLNLSSGRTIKFLANVDPIDVYRS
mmetsp:Transcript_85629/g.128299  ORF Transcript_85629/g.128299 Transcript_85629/m.128299 type:complete len:83 (+) Transcript_85629:193-441(+)